MAQANQRDLLKAARQGKTDGDKGTKTLMREIKLQNKNDPEKALDYNEDPPFNRTALWEAVTMNHEHIVKDLMSAKAQVDIPDINKRSPLHEACYYGYRPLVELLLDNKADINWKDKDGETPLFRAVAGERIEIVELLIKRGAKTNEINSYNVTVSHIAAFDGNPELSWWLYNEEAWKNRLEQDWELEGEGKGHDFKFAEKKVDQEKRRLAVAAALAAPIEPESPKSQAP